MSSSRTQARLPSLSSSVIAPSESPFWILCTSRFAKFLVRHRLASVAQLLTSQQLLAWLS